MYLAKTTHTRGVACKHRPRGQMARKPQEVNYIPKLIALPVSAKHAASVYNRVLLCVCVCTHCNYWMPGGVTVHITFIIATV